MAIISEIHRLRSLRSIAQNLSKTLIDDLSKYLDPNNGVTFFRLPDDKDKDPKVSISVTCSCLMALAAQGKLREFELRHKTVPRKGKEPVEWSAIKALEVILETPIWSSSGLASMNAFTTTLVVRVFGFLKESTVLGESAETILTKKHPHTYIREAGDKTEEETIPKSLEELINHLLEDPKETLRVGKYPANGAIGYWLIDGLHRASFTLAREKWERLATWASREFWQQLSLVESGSDVLMDPVAMAMCACLCARIGCGSFRTTDMLSNGAAFGDRAA